MSIKYTSSILFDKPHLTIQHLKIQQILYNHKKKLNINSRSTSQDTAYKIQKLSLNQAKKLQCLSSRTKQYSLNRLLCSYNENHQQNIVHNNKNKQKNFYSTINPQQNNYKTLNLYDKNTQSSTICQEKLKLFKKGVNYNSPTRTKGYGVAKINIDSLKQYYQRAPQQEELFMNKFVQNDTCMSQLSDISKFSVQTKNKSKIGTARSRNSSIIRSYKSALN